MNAQKGDMNRQLCTFYAECLFIALDSVFQLASIIDSLIGRVYASMPQGARERKSNEPTHSNSTHELSRLSSDSLFRLLHRFVQRLKFSGTLTRYFECTTIRISEHFFLILFRSQLRHNLQSNTCTVVLQSCSTGSVPHVDLRQLQLNFRYLAQN